jgi:hypothetical protein
MKNILEDISQLTNEEILQSKKVFRLKRKTKEHIF